MKHLKGYKIFEAAGKLLPSTWIKLFSIGHVLDPETGWLYPLYSNGIYYEDDNGLNIEWGDASLDGISDKDMKVIDDLWKSVEPIVKDKIDFDLIDKLKDLSLDAIDDGFTLHYAIYLGKKEDIDHSEAGYTESKSPQRIAYGTFNHQLDKFTYNRKFPKNYKKVLENNEVLYSFRLGSRLNTNGYDVSEEILRTLKDITGYDNIEVID